MSYGPPNHRRRRSTTPRGLSRREFLSTSGRLALAAGLAAPLAGALGCGGSSGANAAAWTALERSLAGPLLRPGSPGYDAARLPSNRRYAAVRPAGIAQCQGSDDVRTCLLWARDHGVALRARGGGHSFAGFSTTEGLQIDVSPLRGVSVDREHGVLHVGAGARNMELAATLPAYDLALPGGRCPTVCLSGFTLGGGLGFNSRQLGTASDRLLATEIVTADGDILMCDPRQNADLFWACRGGGGGNFGINTSFTYQLAAVPDQVAVSYLEWRGRDAAAAALQAYQPLLVGAPEAYSGLFCIVGDGEEPERAENLFSYLLAQYVGPLDDLHALIEPTRRAAPPVSEESLALPFWQAQEYLAESGDVPHASFDRSNFGVAPLPDEAIARVLDALERFPVNSPDSFGVCALVNWVGGALRRTPADATAFVHRDAAYLFEVGSAWPGDDPASTERDVTAWVDALWRDAQRYVTPYAYQNFIDAALTDWQQAYYGANLDRLVATKAAYDPDDVFRFAQSIPTRL